MDELPQILCQKLLKKKEGNEDLVLVNVCPPTLGIETTGDGKIKPIPRNTVIMAKKCQMFVYSACM